MTELIPKAELAFLSRPSQAQRLLNLQFEDGTFMRIEITQGQLCNFVADGAKWVADDLARGRRE